MNKPTAKLFRVVDSSDKVEKSVCLCSRQMLHGQNKDCIIAGPGTPWWRALEDVEVGETVTVSLPGRDVTLRVIESHDIPVVAAA